MVFRTLVNLTSKRIPMIRFRKGGLPQESAAEGGQVFADATEYHIAEAIEDWELPRRYWRKPIDPEEAEYINRGGPESTEASQLNITT